MGVNFDQHIMSNAHANLMKNIAIALRNCLLNVPEDGSITRSIVMSSLSQDHGPVEAANLFDKALDNGILHRQAGRYVVPIPSMQNWLVSNYGREQIELPYSDREETKVRQRNFGHDLGGR